MKNFCPDQRPHKQDRKKDEQDRIKKQKRQIKITSTAGMPDHLQTKDKIERYCDDEQWHVLRFHHPYQEKRDRKTTCYPGANHQKHTRMS